MTEPAKPGILDRLARAVSRGSTTSCAPRSAISDSKGDFYAAGITYFTIFALFPLLMVAFAVARVRAGQPGRTCSPRSTDKIKSTVSGDLGQQLVDLMDSAIESRTSVGIIGLATAAWAGLGWMANLREALSQMWGLQRQEHARFRPHQALRSARHRCRLFVAIVVTVALTALGNSGLMKQVVEWLGLQDLPGMSIVLRVASHRRCRSWSRGCCSPGSSPGCLASRSASAARRGPGCWSRWPSRSSSRLRRSI